MFNGVKWDCSEIKRMDTAAQKGINNGTDNEIKKPSELKLKWAQTWNEGQGGKVLAARAGRGVGVEGGEGQRDLGQRELSVSPFLWLSHSRPSVGPRGGSRRHSEHQCAAGRGEGRLSFSCRVRYIVWLTSAWRLGGSVSIWNFGFPWLRIDCIVDGDLNRKSSFFIIVVYLFLFDVIRQM